jgi:hypothetical protein
MGLIEKGTARVRVVCGFFSSALFFCAALTLSVPSLSAQSPGVLLGAEIQNIEKTLKDTSGSGGAARREALVRLANLRELSGDFEGAAKAWFEAAGASGSNAAQDEDALVSGAYCLAYTGEWERAAAAVRAVLLAGRPGEALVRARFLGACAEAWNTADLRALAALADNSEFAGLKSSIYYVLWKVSAGNPGTGNPGGAEGWKVRLLAEFPQSPEGCIAAAENAAAPVSARPSPMWLLLPGRGGFTFAPDGGSSAAAPSDSAARPSSARNSPGGPDAPSSSAASSPPAAPSPGSRAETAAPGGALFLQTGLFSGEANARAQSDRLRSAGFAPAIIRRTVNGAEYWAVTVPPGADVNRTILELKNAGFESFPEF